MKYQNLREKLVYAGKILCANGQDDLTRGHVSARIPDNSGLFLMKPHSVGLDELTPESLLMIDLEGNVVEGDGRRHSEAFIHTEIYRSRDDVQAVLHTHPTYCVALSASGQPLLPVSQPAALFFNSLGTYTDTINLIRTPEMGAGVAAALGTNRAVLLRHHGIVCTGSSVEEAVIGAIMLENAAMIQMITSATGQVSELFSDEDILKLQNAIGKQEQFTINFNYLARRINKKQL
ncbi:aldolase [Thalassospira profundimaris]|uniref:Aldolase n=1 Tax=Thalassospira profundimaris TaxID=502049 RepID=A0A367WYE1_9PROT|nr:class II aldolase/adducin family protein [Thalassospira profundimaris]RCK46463.1 aldolase [Thalassospira profundimaris]